MEEFSENEFFQNIKLCSKITTFAESFNSRVHVSEDFDYNNCDIVENEFVCYSKKREIMPIKNPKDFSCKTDLILYTLRSLIVVYARLAIIPKNFVNLHVCRDLHIYKIKQKFDPTCLFRHYMIT